MHKILIALIVFFSVGCSHHGPAAQTNLRIATFNVALGLRNAGELQQNLLSGEDEKLRKVAAIIQQIRPDILMLNEFDYQAGTDSAALFNQNYLAISQDGNEPIQYPWSHSGPVNTGDPSGLDLDNNGTNSDLEDSWSFGFFPGQYAMALLSAYPLKSDAVRTFRTFRWQQMPGAKLPVDPETGESWYPDNVASQLRLSSKNHWDIPLDVAGETIHILAFHPTPPVFDGPEDRNGLRNHDEIRLFADYISPEKSAYIVDDAGQSGGLAEGAAFVILGDMNADPFDGDSSGNPIELFLGHPRITATCEPASAGAVEATRLQGRVNAQHAGDPALDTSDFNDESPGNLRIDYLFPSAGLTVSDCGVFWPTSEQPGAELVTVSDHRLVWIDLKL